jgi:hypothetical protein
METLLEGAIQCKGISLADCADLPLMREIRLERGHREFPLGS